MKLDIISSILSLIATFKATNKSISTYIYYISACGLNIIFYYNTALYNLCLYEFVFLCLAIAGLLQWYNQSANSQFQIFLGVSFVSLLLGFGIIQQNSVVEIFATCCAVVAQILMGIQSVLSWYFWIISDIFIIMVMIENQAIGHTALYCCYLVIAIFGIIKWNQSNGSLLNRQWQK